MDYVLSQFAPGTYAIAIEDTNTWDMPTYTNCYVLKRQDAIILIDAGLSDYQAPLLMALTGVGISPTDVTHILLTHGHRDHAEGAGIFRQARKLMHSADRALLPDRLAKDFAFYDFPERAGVAKLAGLEGLEVIHVNYHSPGSVVIYDYFAKAMFAGDFFCFFGEALPDGELVAYSEQTRRESYQYVAEQAASGEAGFADFMQGLARLLPYQAEYFCTGHGVVLKGEIHAFLANLQQSGRG
ncbi:MAG: MBL fold metallo-hydrolase [Negativicutes bacterium]|nr:MBL fold metallo-hydrolase [Negativicutes bacterium]